MQIPDKRTTIEKGTIKLGFPPALCKWIFIIRCTLNIPMQSNPRHHYNKVSHYLGSGTTYFAGGQFASWLRIMIFPKIVNSPPLPSDIPGLRQMRLWNHCQSVSWRQCSVNSIAQCTAVHAWPMIIGHYCSTVQYSTGLQIVVSCVPPWGPLV